MLMRRIGKLFNVVMIGRLTFALPASAEEIARQCHALFDTSPGLQTHNFEFQTKNGKLAAKALVESFERKRDVEFKEAKLKGDTLKFVGRRQFGDRELRIEYPSEQTISLTQARSGIHS